MKPGCVNFIGATSQDNGITARIENEGFRYPANTITVSYNGSVGEAFYQEESYWASDDINVLAPRFKLNREIALYICSLIRQVGRRYAYTFKWTREIMKNDTICVPVDSLGAIDFGYMESFIRALEEDRIRALEAYLATAGLDDCELTDAERRAVLDWRNGSVPCKSFKVGDLFDVRSNPQLNKESFKFSDNAEYPYFTRTVFNNGILGYVDYLDDDHMIPGGSLAVGMLGMQFFYMQHDFYAGQFTKTVFPKFSGFDEPVALFFASLFNKGRNQFLKGLVRDFKRLFLEYEIDVPVDESGEIDMDFVRAFIKGTMKQAIRGVVAWKDREIAAAKRTVGT